MIRTIRSIRTNSPTLISPLPSKFGRKVRRQVATASSQPETMDQDNDNDKTHNSTDVSGDVTSHPFGEAYATRCDEEGFGGIYGKTEDDDHHIDRDDKPQGSEVKEKERARNQTQAQC